MDTSLLTRVLGHRATLIHGNTLVLDRWQWLKRRLPRTANGEALLDVGCGSGAFTIGAALRGYEALGLSWDERNQHVATERAALCGADSARFEIQDVRDLDTRTDLLERFDVAICCENIEHILDDARLARAITGCLKPGGRLLLTTPYHHYRAINRVDEGPFSTEEDGGHVRRGYTRGMLLELCEQAGLIYEGTSGCSGFLSQKITGLMRVLDRVHPVLAWIAVLPLRVLPPLLDRPLAALLQWPYFSICLEATKPRYERPAPDKRLAVVEAPR